ncbi:RHS repeat-associated core domain-containing protein, partial [Streptomyces cinereoruber]|uniref:RHS repeat-associated core domain-containing protein n=1 Tax=Streptomyces cinereoruber TaxID=67260 RepID=UPI00362E129A
STRVYAIGDTTRDPVNGGTEVAKATYNDSAASQAPGAVTSVSEKATGDGQLSRTEVNYDGLGRPVKQSVRLDDAGTDRITSYDYNPSGLIRDIHVPRADGVSGTVTVRNTYDPLDRLVLTSEVGGQPLSQHTYDGLTHTVQQVLPPTGTPNDNSERSLARTTTDAAGQTVKIEERSGGTLAAPVFATTTYRYDGAGRTSKMTDPDGAVTTMAHDYTGNRLSITSENDTTTTADNRTWTYAYDGNNQMTTVTEPVPAGRTAAEFTHSSEYDDLGRVVKEKPATRGMNEALLDELKIGERTYTYDIAHSSLPRLSGKANFQVGKLSYTTAKDRTGNTVTQTVNRYDQHGHLTSTSQDVPGLTTLIQGTGMDKLQADTVSDAAGIAESSEVRAFNTAGVETFNSVKTDVDYDRDGTPTQVGFVLAGKNMTIRHDRNTAGVISKRVTNTQNTSGFGAPTVDFGHDKYGRITSLTAKIGATQRYKQTLGYLQNDEIGHITEQLGGTAEGTLTTTYTYDPRKQLKTAVQSASTTPATGTKGYIGLNTSYTYTPGGRIASAAVASAQPGKRLAVRNVDHVYGAGGDVQRLKKLTRQGDGSTVGNEYTYDEAGNTLTRPVPVGPQAPDTYQTVTQTWDGGRLRKTTRPGGEKELYFYDGANRIATARYNTAGTLTELQRSFGNLQVIYTPGQAPKYQQSIGLGGDTVARIDGNKTTGTLEHYLTSPQGHHVLALTPDTNAAIARTATYGPYGEALTEYADITIPAGKYRKDFNNKETDPVSGLADYGHRSYDTLTQQWTSADPKYRFAPDQSTPRRANLYTYTLNNPINHVDPDGLDPTTDLFATVLEHAGVPRNAQPEVIAEAHKEILKTTVRASVASIPIVGNIAQGNVNGLAVEVTILAVGSLIPGQADEQALRALAKSDNVAPAARPATRPTPKPTTPTTRGVKEMASDGSGPVGRAPYSRHGNLVSFHTPIRSDNSSDLYPVLDDAVENNVSHAHIASGTHGSPDGEWAGNNPELADVSLVHIDERLTEIYGREGLRVSVYDMGDDIDRAVFQSLQQNNPNELFVKAWCYSASCFFK